MRVIIFFLTIIYWGDCFAFSKDMQNEISVEIKYNDISIESFKTNASQNKINKRIYNKQDSINSEKIFTNIKNEFQNKNYSKAKENYLKLKNRYFAEWAYPNSLEWLMNASYKIKKYTLCKYYCFEMSNNDFSEVEQKSRGMRIPAYNFKGISNYFLAKIYFDEKQYNKCLYYIKNARYIAYDNYLAIDEQKENLNKAVIVAKCYYAKGKLNQAINTLLTYAFCDYTDRTMINGFYTHKELVNLLIKLLKEEHTVSDMRIEFNSSYSKISDNEKYIQLFDYQIPIYYGGNSCKFIDGNSTTIKQYISNSFFYKMIN